MKFKINRISKTSKIRKTNPYGENWFSVSRSVKERDGFRCIKCGATENLEVHHIIPVSKGGSNSMRNLITLCHNCHKKQPRHKHIK